VSGPYMPKGLAPSIMPAEYRSGTISPVRSGLADLGIAPAHGERLENAYAAEPAAIQQALEELRALVRRSRRRLPAGITAR